MKVVGGVLNIRQGQYQVMDDIMYDVCHILFIRPHYQMTSLTFDVTETTVILDKVFFQVYSSKRGYFYKNQNKGASLLLLDLHKSFIMVGTFEREAFT